MKIFLTFDYELYFGKQTGTALKCMIEPTSNRTPNYNELYTFFVDVGYLIQADRYPELLDEVTRVKAQVKEMISLGHDVQLHIHPHWEKAKFSNGKWAMNIKGSYKLSDFNATERMAIVRTYKLYLEQLIDREVTAFRAGGFCVQPFSALKTVFEELELKIDSSVFHGGHFMTDNYNVDFRTVPLKSKYNFKNDVCKEVTDGPFIEYPISSFRYRPSFYWMLYGLGKLFPSRHKGIGDGQFISQGGSKLLSLVTYKTYQYRQSSLLCKKIKC